MICWFLKPMVIFLNINGYVANIATSSIRRKAQWLNKYPHHQLHNLRGNVNTRLKKIGSRKLGCGHLCPGGIERIICGLENSMVMDWMLPAPAQGAIMVVCREDDKHDL